MDRRLLLRAAGAGLTGAAGLGPVLLSVLGPRPARAQDARLIPVVARRFVFVPDEIEVQLHETVVLAFTAPEVVMGFYCPELKLRTVIVPGQQPQVRWTAERAGRFDFVCDVFCGDGHEGMAGRLVVA